MKKLGKLIRDQDINPWGGLAPSLENENKIPCSRYITDRLYYPMETMLVWNFEFMLTESLFEFMLTESLRS